MKRIIMLYAIVLLLVPFTALAQDFCEGNFDYDMDVDGSDAFTFKTDFGRSKIINPCPPDGPAPVPKTWQWISYSPGDDGDYEHGTVWPIPRFTDNGDGTVTDNLTGLMWLKDANCIATNYPGFDNDSYTGTAGDGRVTWQHGLDFVAGINDGIYAYCGGTQPYNDWRLPHIRELHSLIHYGFINPSIPCTAGPCHWQEGDPFINVRSSHYWSSTTYAQIDGSAAVVSMYNATLTYDVKSQCYFIWPVRGGH